MMIIDRETFTELAVHLKLASDAVLATARHLAVLSNGDNGPTSTGRARWTASMNMNTELPSWSASCGRSWKRTARKSSRPAHREEVRAPSVLTDPFAVGRESGVGRAPSLSPDQSASRVWRPPG
jgi:hypothetical protein